MVETLEKNNFKIGQIILWVGRWFSRWSNWYRERVGSEAVLGEETITSNETGQEINNPAHGIPIIGGLFGFGMKVGNATYDYLRLETWVFN